MLFRNDDAEPFTRHQMAGALQGVFKERALPVKRAVLFWHRFATGVCGQGRKAGAITGRQHDSPDLLLQLHDPLSPLWYQTCGRAPRPASRRVATGMVSSSWGPRAKLRARAE